jgi:hypothetical protein
MSVCHPRPASRRGCVPGHVPGPGTPGSDHFATQRGRWMGPRSRYRIAKSAQRTLGCSKVNLDSTNGSSGFVTLVWLLMLVLVGLDVLRTARPTLRKRTLPIAFSLVGWVETCEAGRGPPMSLLRNQLLRANPSE